MPTFTHTEFRVDDANGGAPNRLFTFDTYAQGDNYPVTATWDGSGPVTVTLSTASPTAPIPDSPARVKATGILTLVWDSAETQRLILFTGTLHTTHSTSMVGVCVGAVD
jgi:hypothetical protein